MPDPLKKLDFKKEYCEEWIKNYEEMDGWIVSYFSFEMFIPTSLPSGLLRLTLRTCGVMQWKSPELNELIL